MAIAPKALSFSEIQKRLKEMDDERAELELALQAKRGEELKVLADAYAKKLEAAGFSIAEGIKAIAPYDRSIKKRATRDTTGARPIRSVETGKTYRDPASGQTWTAGSKGRIVGWLQAHINAGKSAGDFVNNS